MMGTTMPDMTATGYPRSLHHRIRLQSKLPNAESSICRIIGRAPGGGVTCPSFGGRHEHRRVECPSE